MRYTTSETSLHRIIGMTTCMLACALIIIGAFPDLQSWNFFDLPVETRVIVRIWIGFALWLYGVIFAAWPEMRKGF
ncbi:MAG: hypothetical protein PHS73_03070 [Candidatus Peribacteraceae bacterium]|nr:hypothetical protein [Candidatus Peribacteraceae bacterium]